MPIDRYLNDITHNANCSRKNCPTCMAATEPVPPSGGTFCCQYDSAGGPVYVYTPKVEALLMRKSSAPTSGAAKTTLTSRGSKGKASARSKVLIPPRKSQAKKPAKTQPSRTKTAKPSNKKAAPRRRSAKR